MALTDAFKEAVEKGNVREIRIMLKDSLLVDPTFERFNEMERAASSVAGLYDEHDGRKFETDKSLWNDEYMDKLMVQVVFNFSHERIRHLKDVVRHIRPVSADNKTNRDSNKITYVRPDNYQEQKYADQKAGNYYAVAGGAVAGGVVGGIIGAAASLPVYGIAGCAVAGAVIGGGAAYVISERN